MYNEEEEEATEGSTFEVSFMEIDIDKEVERYREMES